MLSTYERVDACKKMRNAFIMKAIIIRPLVWIILLGFLIYLIIAMRTNTINWSSRSQYELRASAQASLIYNSILSFRAEYGANPILQNLDGVGSCDMIYGVITDAPESTKLKKLRLEGVGWLRPITNYNKGNMFLDPWGMPYHVKLSEMKETFITLGNRKIASAVAVWSSGKNGIDELGEGDDICSWKLHKNK